MLAVPRLTRRALLQTALAAAPGAWLAGRGARWRAAAQPAAPQPWRRWHGESSIGAALRAPVIPAGSPLAVVQADLLTGVAQPARTPPYDQDLLAPGLGKQPPPRARISPIAQLQRRFPHLRRHFVFEYYAWYRTAPWVHWNEGGHTPPASLASTSMPALGPYDSGDVRVIEQHARWMADAGAGAIALSWWGRESDDNRLTHLIMDVMRAHDIHVMFHLEPYRPDRATVFASDVLYLLNEYGEKRRWDGFLLLERADGTSAPVFKAFRSILPQTIVDCRGLTVEVPDYAPDSTWRAQTDLLRRAVTPTFPDLVLLADSLDRGRTLAAGFDGIAIYDSYVRPHTWPGIGNTFSQEDLLSTFSINCGFDGFIPKVPRYVCDIPLPFEPPVGQIDWNAAASRALAEAASRQRISESFDMTLTVQTSPTGANSRRGFFLTFINTFNEWHEGTSFEPARPRSGLTAEELAAGYHNAEDGDYRLRLLEALLPPVTAGSR